MTITYTLSGSTQRTNQFLTAMQSPDQLYSDLATLAQRGVIALQNATPKDTGLTALSWSYEIEIENGRVTISWLNTNKNGEVHIALLLQYGHGTGTGGYVPGQDYINTAMKPIFDEIADSVWKRVENA